MQGLSEVIRSRLLEGGNEIIISFCNFGYVDFVLNLVHCFTTLNVTNYLIFSLDLNSHEALEKHGVASYYFKKEDAVYTEESSNFGEVGFKAICNEKPFLVLEVMKLGFNVLWTDSDIVWLDNPFKHFDMSHDLIVQRDDDDMCAGFFFIKSG